MQFISPFCQIRVDVFKVACGTTPSFMERSFRRYSVQQHKRLLSLDILHSHDVRSKNLIRLPKLHLSMIQGGPKYYDIKLYNRLPQQSIKQQRNSNVIIVVIYNFFL